MIWFVSLVFFYVGFHNCSLFFTFHSSFGFTINFYRFWSFPLSRFRMFCFQFDIFNRYVSDVSRCCDRFDFFFDRFDVLAHDVSDDDFSYSDVSGTMSLR